MNIPEADRAVFRGLSHILAAYDAVPAVFPVRYAVSEAFAARPSHEVLLKAVRLLAPGGRIVDAPDAAAQPCVCAVRLGMTGAFPVVVLVNATDCGGRTRISVRTAARALPFPGRAKRTADEFLQKILGA